MRARRAININDGRIVIRTEATDALRGMYRPIPDDVVKAIVDGKVDRMTVVNAIMKKERFGESWSWDKYKEEIKVLNVRQTKVDFGDDHVEIPEDQKVDDPGDMISLKEIVGGGDRQKQRQKLQAQPKEDEPEKGAEVAGEVHEPAGGVNL